MDAGEISGVAPVGEPTEGSATGAVGVGRPTEPPQVSPPRGESTEGWCSGAGGTGGSAERGAEESSCGLGSS